jgi:phosphatidylglycerol:prolipoprotein diacylglycerol transferase
VVLAMALFARLRRRPFLQVTDLIAPCVPTGLASGRIGNFINGELWGRQADAALPWAMAFPQSGSMVARHPSQLYQFLLEGLLLFALLWWYGGRTRPTGQVLRFVAEYFREPDSFLGLLALNMSMGQWLCVPMVLAGVWLMRWSARATSLR